MLVDLKLVGDKIHIRAAGAGGAIRPAEWVVGPYQSWRGWKYRRLRRLCGGVRELESAPEWLARVEPGGPGGYSGDQ